MRIALRNVEILISLQKSTNEINETFLPTKHTRYTVYSMRPEDIQRPRASALSPILTYWAWFIRMGDTVRDPRTSSGRGRVPYLPYLPIGHGLYVWDIQYETRGHPAAEGECLISHTYLLGMVYTYGIYSTRPEDIQRPRASALSPILTYWAWFM